jgi:hypothetical protein
MRCQFQFKGLKLSKIVALNGLLVEFAILATYRLFSQSQMPKRNPALPQERIFASSVKIGLYLK